jgi:urea carboxylase system permease
LSRSAGVDDVRDLATFGYRQRLDRTLGGFSAFAAGFSYLSVLTGSSQLFHLGFAAGGPAFFWTWPVVSLGQFLVALCFAELAAQYPLSGGVYQWSKKVGTERLGWMAGWVYLACAVITLASVALALQTTLTQLSPVFQLVGHSNDAVDGARNAVLLGCLAIGFSTIVNTVGIRVLARINNVGALVEMLGALLLIALLSLAAKRGPEIVFESRGRGDGSPIGYLGPALAASIMATFVLYGFDTAGSLAEETDDPRRRAPRAILLSLLAVGIAGSLLAFTAIRAVGNLDAPELSNSGGGLPYVVKNSLGAVLGTPFLCVVALSIIVCTLTVHAAAVRLVFAMARDNNLPWAALMARVSEGARTPAAPALLVGLSATALLLVNLNFPRVIEVMTSTAVLWANLAYLFVTIPLLRSRFGRRGEQDLQPAPRKSRSFDLGRWGMPVNIAAVAWGTLVVVNMAWPRAEVYGTGFPERYAAVFSTAAMLGAGWLYDRCARRGCSGVLDEHRACDLAIPKSVCMTPE